MLNGSHCTLVSKLTVSGRGRCLLSEARAKYFLTIIIADDDRPESDIMLHLTAVAV